MYKINSVVTVILRDSYPVFHWGNGVLGQSVKNTVELLLNKLVITN